MKESTATRIMAHLDTIRKAINDIEPLTHQMDDIERKKFCRTFGGDLIYSYLEVVRFVAEQYPYLDPDRED